MPRNGDGSYSRPAGSRPQTGDTLDPGQYNTQIDDIASALSDANPVTVQQHGTEISDLQNSVSTLTTGLATKADKDEVVPVDGVGRANIHAEDGVVPRINRAGPGTDFWRDRVLDLRSFRPGIFFKDVSTNARSALVSVEGSWLWVQRVDADVDTGTDDLTAGQIASVMRLNLDSGRMELAGKKVLVEGDIPLPPKLYDAYISDERPNGVNGQASTTTWSTKEFNTEFDPDGIVALSNNKITPSVDCEMQGWCYTYRSDLGSLRIVEDGSSTAVAVGTSARSDNNEASTATIDFYCRLEAGKTYLIQTKASFALSRGQGTPGSHGIPELYAFVGFRKLYS